MYAYCLVFPHSLFSRACMMRSSASEDYSCPGIESCRWRTCRAARFRPPASITEDLDLSSRCDILIVIVVVTSFEEDTWPPLVRAKRRTLDSCQRIWIHKHSTSNPEFSPLKLYISALFIPHSLLHIKGIAHNEDLGNSCPRAAGWPCRRCICF